MSIEWDVDSYKTEFETDEHWELRKRFMLAHKDKFSEDELVCLAQVFTNIEFMGCRYPEQTMKRVAYLAKGVVEDFREKKKNCLKRTFVAASDAASAKVKGLKADQEVKPMPDQYPDPPKVREEKIDETKSKNSNKKHSKKEINSIREPKLKTDNVDTATCSAITNKAQRLLEDKVRKSVLDNFVVVYSEKKDNPLAILSKSVAANNCQMSWCFENAHSPGRQTGKLYFNGELIAEAEGDNIKQCRKQASKAALDKLKQNCFGIRVNRAYRALGVCNRDFVVKNEDNISNILAENNIGCRLMILMGWKGGGLGREEQGIIEPITLNMLAPREGFGVKPDLNNFKKKAESFLRDWVKSDSKDDLLFSSDFTTEERKELHLIAHSFSLKSKSQGKKNNRRLLISRTQHPLQIVEDLIKAGGKTSKFDLVYPGKLNPNPPVKGNGRNK